VGEVVGVQRVHRAGQLQDVRAAPHQTAQDVDRVELGAHEQVRRVRAHAVGELRLRWGGLQGGGHLAAGVLRHVRALATGVGQDLLCFLAARRPGVDEVARFRGLHARVAARLGGRVVAVGGLVVRRHLCLVRVRRPPGGVLRGPVRLDRRPRPLLRPAHRLRVRLQRARRRRTRVRRRQPLLRLDVELRAERVRRPAAPLARVEGAHALADVLEGRRELPQVTCPFAQGARAAVDQLSRVLGLAQGAFRDRAAQAVVDALAEVADLLGRAVRAHVRQQPRRLVRAPADRLADALVQALGRALQTVAEVVDQVTEAHQPSPSAESGGPPHCQSVRGSRNASGVTVEVDTSSAACDQAAFTSSWPDVKDSAL